MAGNPIIFGALFTVGAFAANLALGHATKRGVIPTPSPVRRNPRKRPRPRRRRR